MKFKLSQFENISEADESMTLKDAEPTLREMAQKYALGEIPMGILSMYEISAAKFLGHTRADEIIAEEIKKIKGLTMASIRLSTKDKEEIEDEENAPEEKKEEKEEKPFESEKTWHSEQMSGQWKDLLEKYKYPERHPEWAKEKLEFIYGEDYKPNFEEAFANIRALTKPLEFEENESKEVIAAEEKLRQLTFEYWRLELQILNMIANPRTGEARYLSDNDTEKLAIFTDLLKKQSVIQDQLEKQEEIVSDISFSDEESSQLQKNIEKLIEEKDVNKEKVEEKAEVSPEEMSKSEEALKPIVLSLKNLWNEMESINRKVSERINAGESYTDLIEDKERIKENLQETQSKVFHLFPGSAQQTKIKSLEENTEELWNKIRSIVSREKREESLVEPEKSIVSDAKEKIKENQYVMDSLRKPKERADWDVDIEEIVSLLYSESETGEVQSLEESGEHSKEEIDEVKEEAKDYVSKLQTIKKKEKAKGQLSEEDLKKTKKDEKELAFVDTLNYGQLKFLSRYLNNVIKKYKKTHQTDIDRLESIVQSLPKPEYRHSPGKSILDKLSPEQLKRYQEMKPESEELPVAASYKQKIKMKKTAGIVNELSKNLQKILKEYLIPERVREEMENALFALSIDEINRAVEVLDKKSFEEKYGKLESFVKDILSGKKEPFKLWSERINSFVKRAKISIEEELDNLRESFQNNSLLKQADMTAEILNEIGLSENAREIKNGEYDYFLKGINIGKVYFPEKSVVALKNQGLSGIKFFEKLLDTHKVANLRTKAFDNFNTFAVKIDDLEVQDMLKKLGNSVGQYSYVQFTYANKVSGFFNNYKRKIKAKVRKVLNK